MTCVAGFVQKGVAYIGADSARSSEAGLIQTRGAGKLSINGGEFLIGSAGCIRTSQVLRYHFSPLLPETTEYRAADEAYMVCHFVPTLRECLREHNLVLPAQVGATELFDASLLVAWRGVLWEIDSDYQVVHVDGGHHAVGSGHRFALGALHATEGIGFSPEVRLRKALAAAAALEKHVRAPFWWGTSAPGETPRISPL